jgi:hypothetical protein
MQLTTLAYLCASSKMAINPKLIGQQATNGRGQSPLAGRWQEDLSTSPTLEPLRCRKLHLLTGKQPIPEKGYADSGVELIGRADVFWPNYGPVICPKNAFYAVLESIHVA